MLVQQVFDVILLVSGCFDLCQGDDCSVLSLFLYGDLFVQLEDSVVIILYSVFSVGVVLLEVFIILLYVWLLVVLFSLFGLVGGVYLLWLVGCGCECVVVVWEEEEVLLLLVVW